MDEDTIIEDNLEQLTADKTANKHGRRKSAAIDETILTTLRLADKALTTTDVSERIRSHYLVARRHLQLLEFAGKVEALRFGEAGRWCYWRVKR